MTKKTKTKKIKTLSKAAKKALKKHSAQLMRINTQMLEGTIRVLVQQNKHLNQRISELVAENDLLRKSVSKKKAKPL